MTSLFLELVVERFFPTGFESLNVFVFVPEAACRALVCQNVLHKRPPPLLIWQSGAKILGRSFDYSTNLREFRY